MPIYEFSCEDCGHQFEDLVRSDDPCPKCPKCKSQNVKKLVSATGIKTSGKNAFSSAGSPGSCGSGGFS